jgi:hypothetical protein
MSLDALLRGNPDLVPFRDVMEKFFREVLSWKVVGPQMVALYAREFTETELRDLIAFYQTPTGQKFAGKQSELMQKASAITEAQVTANQAELQRRIQERARQLQPRQ